MDALHLIAFWTFAQVVRASSFDLSIRASGQQHTSHIKRQDVRSLS